MNDRTTTAELRAERARDRYDRIVANMIRNGHWRSGTAVGRPCPVKPAFRGRRHGW